MGNGYGNDYDHDCGDGYDCEYGYGYGYEHENEYEYAYAYEYEYERMGMSMSMSMGMSMSVSMSMSVRRMMSFYRIARAYAHVSARDNEHVTGVNVTVTRLEICVEHVSRKLVVNTVCVSGPTEVRCEKSKGIGHVI